MKTKSYRTDILIDDDKYPKDDLNFIRTHGFKPTNLLRAKIKELRAIEEGEPDNQTLLKNLQNISKYRDELIKFIEKKGLLDELLQDGN